MKTLTIFAAFDGTRFDAADECKAYEAAHIETRLVGLTIEQVRAALARDDTELADAIEELGTRINRARRAAGDLRRGKAPADAAARPAETAAPVEEPADKMAEALRRAREAGRAAWDARQGAVVPEAFAAARPLADAWLDGWRGGQAQHAVMAGVAA